MNRPALTRSPAIRRVAHHHLVTLCNLSIGNPDEDAGHEGIMSGSSHHTWPATPSEPCTHGVLLSVLTGGWGGGAGLESRSTACEARGRARCSNCSIESWAGDSSELWSCAPPCATHQALSKDHVEQPFDQQPPQAQRHFAHWAIHSSPGLRLAGSLRHGLSMRTWLRAVRDLSRKLFVLCTLVCGQLTLDRSRSTILEP